MNENYRPISLLFIVSNILAKLIISENSNKVHPYLLNSQQW